MPPNVQTPKKGEYVGRTFEIMMLTGTQESSRREPSSSDSNQKEAATTDDARGKRAESATVTRTKESSEDSSFAHLYEKTHVRSLSNTIRSVDCPESLANGQSIDTI